MRYTIQQIGVLSAVKFGMIIGAGLGLFPGLFGGLLVHRLVRTLRAWLESWLSIEVLGRSFDLLDAVRLGDFLAQLQQWDAQGWLLSLFLVLLIMIGSALITGIFSGLAALIYNLVSTMSGGVVVQASLLTEGSEPRVVPPVPAASLSEVAPPQLFPQPRAAAWLVAQGTQQRWQVGHGETRIGSRQGNQIVLGGLAGNHAAIRRENGRFILYDYSGGQTWVNGRSLSAPNMIKDGFLIQLANQEFLFRE